MFKIIIYLVFGLALLFGFIGCGSSKNWDDTSRGTTEESDRRQNKDSPATTDSSENESTDTRMIEIKSNEVVWNVSTVTEFRQALEDASGNGEHDRIILSAGTYKTTSDGLGTFIFNDNEKFDLTIESAEGLTRKDIVLDGGDTHQVFNFNNTKDSTLIFKGVSVVDGNFTIYGAGIYTNHNIKIENCNILNNNLSDDWSNGGGFYSMGEATVTNSTISNNSVNNNGGGFYSTGKTTIFGSTISNNKAGLYHSKGGGGGFYSNSGTTVSRSIISNNKAGYDGGAFYSSGKTIVKDSTISNNSAIDCGGFCSTGATMVIDSTISSNIATDDAGGFYSLGITIITNSTISNNDATNKAGGFYSTGTTTVTNSIFLNNSANSGDIFYTSRYSTSHVSNNNFIENSGSIYAKGVFVNNIFDNNREDITLLGESKIYNNYIDYGKIDDNGHDVIKKQNLQPSSVGDIHLNRDNKILVSNSLVINKGLNPRSVTFQKIIDNDDIYNQMLKLLKTDIVGNNRVYNGTVDMGTVEFGSN